MQTNYLKVTLNAAILAVIIVLAAGASSAQVVNLTASQQTVVLPDGNTVPMWGWTCGTVTQGTTAGTSCTALTYNAATGTLNPQTGGTVWQPPLIVVPYTAGATAGTSATNLTINLTNNLPVETSIVIIGQVSGGGLGSPVREAGPRTDGAHAGQTSTTWTTVLPGSFIPPSQGARARSFVTEVAGVATVGAASAVGTYTWTGLQAGTYLIRTGTYPSIQGPMGLYGVLVVTQAPTSAAAGIAYPAASATSGAVSYDADVVALESEMDPRQNKMVAALFPTGGAAGTATANAGFDETLKWNPSCGAGANGLTSAGTPPTCYPPAVDYTPLYFFINGVAFSKDNVPASALSVPAAGATGNVLVRFVNAGSHMHVPTVSGLNMLLVAEDGYVLPDISLALSNGKTLFAKNPNQTAPATAASGLRLQNEVFLPAGKVFDVIVSPTQTAAGTYNSATYAIFDRSLDLSTNNQRDGGMQAFLDVNDAGAAKLAAANSTPVANPDTYAYAPGVTLTVSDPGKGVIANDINVYGVQALVLPTSGTLTLYPNGTFTYAPTGSGTDHFTYCANGTVTAGVCSSGLTTTVTLNLSATANAANRPQANNDSYPSKVASILRVAAPGVLGNDVDPNGFPMTAVFVTKAQAGLTVFLNADGSFTATKPAATGCPATGCTFTYQAKNSQGILSNTATVTLNFLPASNLTVHVQDAQTKAAITDYRWIIEQDLTFHIDPACQVNTGTGPRPTGCPVLPPGTIAPPTLGTNLHASFMPVIATGCTGPQSCGRGQTVYDANPNSPTYQQHVQAACDGYGICTVGQTQLHASLPSEVNLPTTDANGNPLYYYISVLPGDAPNSFNYANTKDPAGPGNCTPGQNGNASSEPTGLTASSACGHTMGGAPIAPVCTTGTTTTCTLPTTVSVNVEPTPLHTATITVYVFQDDFPTNGEPDTGGGVDSFPTQEAGLEDFQVIIWDLAGCVSCDNTGQDTYDMFNVPLTNALNGTIDPTTGLDACPISQTQPGVGVGVIIVCPKFESDGATLSPLVGQAVIKNLNPGLFDVTVHPGATRESRGEEWLQTNTLDGTPKLDAFVKAAEPGYFQEYGPGGYHVFFGEANPKIINSRLAGICSGPGAPPCHNTVKVQVTNLHQGRSPDQRLFTSGVFPQGDPRNYAPLNYTTCWVTIGDTDGLTFGLSKCDADGNATFTGIPDGSWAVTAFDQWNDLLVDGSSRSVTVRGGQTLNFEYGSFTWQSHLWNRTYLDTEGRGTPVLDAQGNLDPTLSPGLIQIPTRVRMRNGKINNTLLSDIGGNTHFDETFPLFNWYVLESDTTRFRSTGVHVVNDAGAQVDGPAPNGNGNAGPYQAVLNSKESFSLPSDLSVPGAVYCGQADCSDRNLLTNPAGFPSNGVSTTANTGLSTGRIDPGTVLSEGWQGGVAQYNMIDWGKMPYVPGETGGIRGHVVNATTRPFDDPRMNFQNLWEPLVPNVTVNLYKESTAADGTTSLTLVDTTQTSSWDSWVQGFGGGGRAAGIPNISCPGEDVNDPFFSYTLAGTRNFLNPNTAIPHNSQYKCFDGYHNLNQAQPAPYDGLYVFPSSFCTNNPGGTFTAPSGQTITCATAHNPAYGTTGPATIGGVVQTGAVPAVLPPGKYVTEVVVPPGWELNKEEDLNLLIGDNFIAPVAAQFGGLGNIFIVPDQASIDSWNPSYTGPYTNANCGPTGTSSGTSVCNGTSGPYNQPFANGGFVANTTNNGKPSTDLGRTSFGSFGPGGTIQQSAPCVGLMRIVPDYLSISPESGEVAPFAGSLRPLCDRKEVTLDDQMQANADFLIWTQTPAAAHYTGFITDDFASEFDPANPAFGEKFAVVNVPVSIRDYDGVEVSRVYADQWGTFNGLTPSTWEVNPPNITGYGPNVMIFCMNDPGPIPDPAHPGQFITDPYYNPNYSDFCYEWSLMPGDTAYLDTPVVPTSAFAEGYNPPDCSYPDATPAIKEVDGDGVGPWVSAQGHKLTITALGDQPVQNPAYSGPAANTSPYNLKTVTRHYGFGAAQGKVTIGGANQGIVSWSDTQIVVNVGGNVPPCAMQQRGQPAARCGELVITAANGSQSIDTVTVTVGGKAPTHVPASGSIQSAIDAAAPGDLIIVDPTCTSTTGAAVACATTGAATHSASHHHEMLIMWKPVRLQGVGAASTIVDANTNPAGKLLEPWRRKIDCLFGLAMNGALINNDPNATNPNGTSAYNPYDPTGTYSCSSAYQVDPIPLEPIIGWVASLNGNIAELLQEPSLMGAYEGAAITVLGRGWQQRVLDTADVTGTNNAAGTFTGTLLTNSAADCQYVSNFLCNPSRIDGLSFINSSQGGGGIFLHGWNHYVEISNNRIFNNGGTLAGGITVGQAETPPASFDPTGLIELPFLFNHDVNIHHNSITQNTAYGDELNSNTPASAGGVTFCDGSDYYQFNYNWVCGNLSMGDGGGVAHFGFSWNGRITHNSIVFNQSTNPTLTTYGGGLIVEGVGPDGTLCENSTTLDLDCPPQLPDGIGPGLTIDSNLIQGNTAEGGSGGGLRLQKVNGTDVQRNPNDSSKWYSVTVTNNVIVNNVAGWGGGGVSLLDALNVTFSHNTVASNDSTATAGVLFDSVNAPNANVPPPGCDPTITPPPAACTNASVTTSNFMVAGLQTEVNSGQLSGVMTSPNVTCPAGHPNCTKFSNPLLDKNIFWQNRSFHITTGAIPAPGLETTVQLVPAMTQTTTGSCPSGATYWDIGIYGDGSATNHSSGFTLSPTNSILSSGGYGGTNRSSNPGFAAQYCNGSRVPPEIAPTLCSGANGNANAQGCVQPGTVGISITVPPGITDSTYAGPAFSLTPAATVDEGSNWVNMFYGPLALSNTSLAHTPGTQPTPLGNYSAGAGVNAGAKLPPPYPNQ